MHLMPKQHGGLSQSVLTAALEGLEAQKRKLEEHIAQVRSLLGLGSGRRGRPPKAPAALGEPAGPAARGRKRRKFSAETRARMAAAQKKRWAEKKA
jgi:hypothetical protein